MGKGRRPAQLALVVVVAVLAVFVLIGRPPATRLTAVLSFPATPIASSTPAAWDLDADIGSVLVISTRGGEIEPVMASLLREGKVGGVLLFGSNFGSSPEGLRSWSDRLTWVASQWCLEHPILVMTDKEGGGVTQVLANFAPPSQLVAGSGGADHVRAAERTSAIGLRSAGLGLNLAPVADVRTNARDAVIGDRSFGSNPAVVAPLVAAAVQGMHEGGVGATLKHFPGLGGAPGDPHIAIPTDPESETRWESVQMPAFQAGIAAGADAVMTTAVYVPGLGGGNTPAMFSAPVVSKLRTQLNFGGVIMSDSVSMGGIEARWSLPEATVMALAAGNDLVLLGNGDTSYEADALAAVRAAVLSGRLDRSRLHESAVRVNALRDRWGRRFTPCRAPLAA